MWLQLLELCSLCIRLDSYCNSAAAVPPHAPQNTYLSGVNLARVEAKVGDGIGAIQVHSCFVIGLCCCHIILKPAWGTQA